MEIYHDGAYVPYRLEVFDQIVHGVHIIWAEKTGNSIQSFVDHVVVHAGAKEVLPQEILSLRSPCEVMEQPIE